MEMDNLVTQFDKPRFCKEHVAFQRKEKDGLYSFVLDQKVDGNIHLVNETTQLILDLCDGEKTIQDILLAPI